jgi:hypothetical protein
MLRYPTAMLDEQHPIDDLALAGVDLSPLDRGRYRLTTVPQCLHDLLIFQVVLRCGGNLAQLVALVFIGVVPFRHAFCGGGA